jgi:hypothetical protein
MSGARVALACLIVLLGATSARAQTYRASQRPRFGSLEAGVGAVWVGGVDFGERRAVELRNPTTGTDPLLLFVTNSRLDPVGGLQGRFGFYLSPRLVVEAGARYSKPVLVTRVTDDFEEASDLVARETLSHYVFDASVVFHVAQLGGGRFVPFVQGGAGQVRDLHQRGELVETGTEYHGGGGVKVWLGGGSHKVGIRGDIAASSRKGFDLAGKRRTVPTAGGSVFFVF